MKIVELHLRNPRKGSNSHKCDLNTEHRPYYVKGETFTLTTEELDHLVMGVCHRCHLERGAVRPVKFEKRTVPRPYV